MTYYNNTVSHSGILGMRWGIRRFENKNGTLTEAGKKRYSKRYKSSNEKEYKSDDKQKSVTKSFKNTAVKTIATSALVVTGIAVANRILNDCGHESINHTINRNRLNAKKNFQMAMKYLFRN